MQDENQAVWFELRADATSPSSTGTPPDPAPKKRAPRQAPVCDACRLRRVKCNRADVQEACSSCTRKGIPCTTSKTARKPYKSRTGARIEKAKAMFAPEHASDTVASTSSSSLDLASLDVHLSRTEDSSSFLCSLMDDYWKNSSGSTMVHVHWRVLKDRFTQAGRRLNQMEDPTQTALIRAMVALASLNTDSPALLGPDAPQINSLVRGADLSEFGRRRQQTAQMLMNKALATADSQGLFRQTKPDALALMILLCDVQRFISDDPREARPYLNACISAIKLRGGKKEEEIGNVILLESSSWSCTLADAFISAFRGEHLQIAEEELSDFIGYSRFQYCKKPSLEEVHESASSLDLEQFFWPIVYCWSTLLTIVRRIAKEVSYPIARSFQFPDQNFRDLIDEFDEFEDWCQTVVRSLRAKPIDPAVAQAQQGMVSLDVQSSLETSHYTVQRIAYIFKVQLLRFDHLRQTTPSGFCLFDGDDGIEERVSAIKDHLQPIMQRVAMTFAREVATSSVKEHISYGSGVSSQNDWYGVVIDELMDMPLEDQGGPAGLTLSKKIEYIQALVDGIRLQSWCWPQRSEEVKPYDNKLAMLHFMQHEVSLPPLGMQDPLISKDYFPLPELPGFDEPPSSALGDSQLFDLKSSLL